MSTTLILPDIHNRVLLAWRILKQEAGYDSCIFLGDYFDGWGDTSFEARDTALFIDHEISDPRHVFLMGNHDLSYRYPWNKAAYCPGWTPEKSEAVSKVLTHEHWDKMKYFHVAHDILFSHAGVSKVFKQDDIPFLEWIEMECEYSNSQFKNNNKHGFFKAGKFRGGHEEQSGILWCDHGEFIPTDIPQIYGHSIVRRPDFKLLPKNSKTRGMFYYDVSIGNYSMLETLRTHDWSLNLDTNSNHYAVIEDMKGYKTLSIKHADGTVLLETLL